MPRTLAKGTTRVDFLATADAPADWDAPTAAELGSAIALTCSIVRDGFTLGFTDSDTVSDPSLCDTGNWESLDAANADAKFSIFRYFDTDGQPDSTDDTAFSTLGTRGVTGWLIRRDGPKETTALSSGDKVWAFPVMTDYPQHINDGQGYQKMGINFAITADPFSATISA